MVLIFSIFLVNFELPSQLSVNWIKCSRSNQAMTCGVFLTSQWGRLVTFFVRCENFALYHNKRLLRADPCCRSAIEEFAHAFSSAYIELWRHLGSLESIQKARVLSAAPQATLTLFCALQISRVQTRYTHAKHEQILNFTFADSVDVTE